MEAVELTAEDREGLEEEMTCANTNIAKAPTEEDYRALVNKMIEDGITITYVDYLEIAQIAKDRGWRVPNYSPQPMSHPYADMSDFMEQVIGYKVPPYMKSLINGGS